MILTITLVVTFLVALNFILLFTSCNKTPKTNTPKKSYVVKNDNTMIVTKKLVSDQLAPTGS